VTTRAPAAAALLLLAAAAAGSTLLALGAAAGDESPAGGGAGKGAWIAGGDASAACARCHADAHPGFESSGHAVAATEPWYAASLDHTPEALKPLCAGCHSPTGAASRAGVSCVACHVDRGTGTVLAPRPGMWAGAPHDTRFAPELRDGRLCATCHVVELPVGKDGAWVRLQDTPAEHALWRERTGDGRGCVDCHAGTARPHFAGMRDPAFLASAVALSLALDRDGGAGLVAGALVLDNRAGHAFPAGSQLREAWVRVTVVAPDGRRASALVERLRIIGDPAAGETPVDLRLAPGETRRLPFRVALPEGFPMAGLAVEATVDLALVSLDFEDGHPMIPPGEPRTVPVARVRVEIPETIAFTFTEDR